MECQLCIYFEKGLKCSDTLLRLVFLPIFRETRVRWTGVELEYGLIFPKIDGFGAFEFTFGDTLLSRFFLGLADLILTGGLVASSTFTFFTWYTWFYLCVCFITWLSTSDVYIYRMHGTCPTMGTVNTLFCTDSSMSDWLKNESWSPLGGFFCNYGYQLYFRLILKTNQAVYLLQVYIACVTLLDT